MSNLPFIVWILASLLKLIFTTCKITAVFDRTLHKKGRRANPCNGFYIVVCGGFESKLLLSFVLGENYFEALITFVEH
jgi:hypothetical protein